LSRPEGALAAPSPTLFIIARSTNANIVCYDVHVRRDGQLDLMADLLTAHIDVDAVLTLLDNGPPRRPTIVTTLRG